MISPIGYMLSDDMIFSSKVQATARAHALEVRIAKTQEALLKQFRAMPGSCVILDLHNPGLDLISTLAGIAPAHVVAFGPHVDAAALKAAREAGCAVVIPRSKFVKDLEAELPVWFAAANEAAS